MRLLPRNFSLPLHVSLMLVKRRHMHGLLHLQLIVMMLVLLVLMLLLLLLLVVMLFRRCCLFLLLFVRTTAFVPAVSIAGIEAKSDFCELQCLLSRHLRLVTFLVLLVVDTLCVDPRAELARVLGHNSVSKFSLVHQQILQPLIPALSWTWRPLRTFTPFKDEAHFLQRCQPLRCHRARLPLSPILIIPSCQLDKASQCRMIHRNTTVPILLQEFPKALHLVVPCGVRSSRAELEAEFGESLHFDGIETGAFPWLAADELVVHATLGGNPMSKFGAQGGGYIAVAVFVLVVPQLAPHLVPLQIKVPTRHALPRHAGTSSASRTARHSLTSSMKSQS
mmetsp:Transcript_33805/g.73094  ORF Transcript_33805/g.73094 Transcript_33805/m.73094 type:complete len:336 (-) Transcript_33805:2375-3382(-)